MSRSSEVTALDEIMPRAIKTQEAIQIIITIAITIVITAAICLILITPAMDVPTKLVLS
jgi:hypothetical protein